MAQAGGRNFSDTSQKQQLFNRHRTKLDTNPLQWRQCNPGELGPGGFAAWVLERQKPTSKRKQLENKHTNAHKFEGLSSVPVRVGHVVVAFWLRPLQGRTRLHSCPLLHPRHICPRIARAAQATVYIRSPKHNNNERFGNKQIAKLYFWFDCQKKFVFMWLLCCWYKQHCATASHFIDCGPK